MRSQKRYFQTGIITTFTLSLLAAGCQLHETAAVDDEATFTAPAAGLASHDYERDSVIVKWRETASKATVDGILDRVSGTIRDLDGDGKDDRFAHLAGGRLALVELDGSMDVDRALAALHKDPRVEYAEYNYRLYATILPNDARFGELWGLHNTGQSTGTPDADIDAELAWDTTTGSADIVVGVIDTGIDYNHEDLAANMWVNPGEIAGNGVDDDGNGYIDDVHGINAITGTGDPMDDNDHGSHCAGTIGAVGGNGIGVAGVNWTVSLVGMKFLSAAGSGNTADAIESVNYGVALRNAGVNLRVLSNSWGGGGFSQALSDAITSANNAGILFVAAAGNSSSNNDISPHYPSSYDVPNVVAVASTDRNDNMSSFSSFGATSVDLGAPGSAILSTTPGNLYQTFSGTSMATPHVSGAAALLLSQNDTLTVAELKNILMSSGDPIAALSGTTVSGNRLNVNNALAQVAPPSPTFNMTVSPGSQAINQGQVASYTIDVTSVLGFADPVNLSLSSTPALDATHAFTPGTVTPPGVSTLAITTSTTTAAGDYTLTITGTGGVITKSRTVTLTVRPEGTVVNTYNSTDTPISIPDNDPFGIDSFINVPDSLTISDLSVSVNITHTFIGDLVVILTSPSGTVKTLHSRTGGSTNNLNQTFGASEFNGENSAGSWTLHVSDNAGIDIGTLDSWSLTITGAAAGDPPPPPPNTPPTADFTFTTADLAANFTDASSDSDGTIASWSWSFGDGVTSTLQNPSHTYSAAGTYTVTLTVTDDDGATGSVSKSVTVTEPPVVNITLTVTKSELKNGNQLKVELEWTGGNTANVDIIRNGVVIDTVPNEGRYKDESTVTGTTFTYQVCESGGSGCSNVETVSF